MSKQFNSFRQSSVNFVETAVYAIDTLMVALANASNSQFPTNPKKVEAIVKSLVKGDLLVAPKLARIVGEDDIHIVSGRHRVSAVAEFCRTYGVAPTGKVVAITEANKNNLTPIVPSVECYLFECDNAATLAALMMAENGSRSMSTIEKAVVKSSAGVANLTEQLKIRLSGIILEVLDVTPPTAMGFASLMMTQIKGVRTATAEAVRGIAQNIADYMDENAESMPSNMARDYKQVFEAVMSQSFVWENEEGTEITGPFIDYLNAVIVYVPAEKKSKASESSDTVKAMAEELAKLREMVALQQGGAR